MDDAPAVEIDVIVTAWFTAPDAFVRRPSGLGGLPAALGLWPGAPKRRCPCLAFVVRHPTAGPILVDTGFHPDAVAAPRREFGTLMAIPFRALKPAREPFDAQLRALGVEPAEVARVVLTHLHLDHASGLRLLPSAEVVCDRREWAATSARAATAKGYVGGQLEPVAGRVAPVDLVADGVPHAGFDRTLDLLGDGSIRLLSTPGHTAGHLSVLLRLAGGRQALLAGDAVYAIDDNLRDGALPLLVDDVAAYRGSVAQLRRFAADHPDAAIVPTHDPDAWRALADRRPAGAAACPAPSLSPSADR